MKRVRHIKRAKYARKTVWRKAVDIITPHVVNVEG